MLGKLRSAYAVMREAWLVARVPPNPSIARELGLLAQADAASPRGFAAYLREQPARSRIEVAQDWTPHPQSGEVRLTFDNSLFAPGCLRMRPAKGDGAIIAYLPGNMSGADFVLGTVEHPHRMTEVADGLGMGLAAWDWPLQASRRNGCMYLGLQSLYSGEREYSRILPALGTCLWREMVHELAFCLAQIRRHAGPGRPIHVVGWSMGAAFAYVAPLLGEGIGTTIAAGSCARFTDLMAEGKTRVHGFFFYPSNGVRYYDLDHVVGDVLAAGRALRIVFGEQDGGCLASSVQAVRKAGQAHGALLDITVLPNHGHNFSPAIKERVRQLLA